MEVYTLAVNTVDEVQEQARETRKTQRKPKPGPLPGQEKFPDSIPDDLPKNINFNTDNEKSRTAYSYTLAKFLVILSLVGAEIGQNPALFMQDEEAVNIAIPAMTILMRMKWFVQASSQFGQYAVSLDEYILLFWAVYMYYVRVRKESVSEQTVQRGNAVGPKQADNGNVSREHIKPGELSRVGRDT
jgi:hypothetical protein